MKKELLAFVMISSLLSAQHEFTNDIIVKNYSPTVVLERNTDTGGFTQGIQTRMLNGTNNWFFGNLGNQYWLVSKGNHENAMLTVSEDGNVGVGTMNPQSKFQVAGGINIAGGFPIQLAGNDSSHGLKYKRNNSDNSLLDGPFLYGWTGGGLGVKKNDNEFNVLSWNESGNVAIQGKLEAKEVKVTLTPTADFVFDENYDLPKLDAVEKHIKEKKHLPEIASAKEMEKEGVNVGEFQIKLLQKIEELTLYTIELNKQLKKQAEEIEVLKKANK
ncbi:uncharacterized protein CHSO_0807 [Chryseobacterium sp. StRB126]|uniref:hypothetical protein n=1 Tax=Chryseobacterium sp. StRB126 TaxID=878220 RepID=UPI0004E99EF7|nr:hypothetical protein [Chryseobacterium sp. StRB126]BAP29844.1 uncharacterized protein CHSO_0807 [Chryseobacterium sp. StRB126]